MTIFIAYCAIAFIIFTAIVFLKVVNIIKKHKEYVKDKTEITEQQLIDIRESLKSQLFDFMEVIYFPILFSVIWIIYVPYKIISEIIKGDLIDIVFNFIGTKFDNFSNRTVNYFMKHFIKIPQEKSKKYIDGYNYRDGGVIIENEKECVTTKSDGHYRIPMLINVEDDSTEENNGEIESLHI